MNKYTNIEMLNNRIETLKNIQFNIDHWMFSNALLKGEMRILDIGCGSGKQIDYLDKLLCKKNMNADIVAVDLSKEALDHLSAKQYTNITVNTINCSIDDLKDNIDFHQFDLIYSVYAIYYSKDLIGFLKNVLASLRPDTQCLWVGNGYGSNLELVNAIKAKYPDSDIDIGLDFINLSHLFKLSKYRVHFYFDRLNNKIIYSPNDFLKWWKNHPWYSDIFHSSVEDFVEGKKSISMTKNNLLLNFIKK